MRTLLFGALAATLIGCSCLAPAQLEMSGCSQTSGPFCLGRTAENAPTELTPPSTRVHSARKEVKSKLPKDNPSSAKAGTRAVAEKPKSAVSARAEDPQANDPVETTDSVMSRAKTAIAKKMENPESAEFQDMKRAMRKNIFRQDVDTICGHVKGSNASGEDTGEMPFLYLVKDDDAYLVNGGPETAAATAYRNICN
jgi:hypothetical protein